MALYCGIDLHSNNHVVVVIDEQDRRLEEKRLPNDLAATVRLLAPYAEELHGIAVESTFNWYWLVDGLMTHGYAVSLVNTPAAQKRYGDLKYSDDRHDAFWLAHLLRLGILPTGYIYPKAERGVRDLLRRRAGLVRVAARQLISIQSQIWRSSGVRVASQVIKRVDFQPQLEDTHEQLAIDSALTVLRSARTEVQRLERAALAVMQPRPEYQVLQTMSGVGTVLGLTISLETGPIERFAGPGRYASYCRLVDSRHVSNGKKKGEGNARAGNKYLSWAFSEAAHFGVRYEPRAKRFYERKRAQRNGIAAIRAVAHKLARAAYVMLKQQQPFDARHLFH
jgi:transposase